MATRVRTFAPDDAIDDLLDDLRDAYAVLICDTDERLIAIVTSFDTTEYFRRRAEDMMTIGDIEALLKEFIRFAFAAKDGRPEPPELSRVISETAPEREHTKKAAKIVAKYATAQNTQLAIDRTLLTKLVDAEYGLSAKPLERLTLQHFIDLLLHDEKWPELQPLFSVDKAAVRRVLEGVRGSRNKLAHFRAGLTDDERRQLRFALDWVKRVRLAFLDYYKVRKPPVPTPAILPTIVEADDQALRRIRRGQSRYAPLGEWLRNQSAETTTLQATFRQVESLVGALPASARHHYTWWANDRMSHSQSKQWLNAGWVMADVDLDAEGVTFERIPEHDLKYRRFFDPLLPVLRQRLHWASPIRSLTRREEDWVIDNFRPSGQPDRIALGFGDEGLSVAFAENLRSTVRLERLKAFESDIMRLAGFDSVLWEEDNAGALWVEFSRAVDLDGTADELQTARDWLLELVWTVVTLCDNELNVNPTPAAAE